jgi:hypothetical protein
LNLLGSTPLSSSKGQTVNNLQSCCTPRSVFAAMMMTLLYGVLPSSPSSEYLHRLIMATGENSVPSNGQYVIYILPSLIHCKVSIEIDN